MNQVRQRCSVCGDQYTWIKDAPLWCQVCDEMQKNPATQNIAVWVMKVVDLAVEDVRAS